MVRDLPYLGRPRGEGQQWTCGFAPAPGAPECGGDATWHGFVLDDEAQNIIAMMSTCDDHLRWMKLTADYIHPMRHPCGIPGSRFRWPENECYTDWDDAELLTAEAEIGVPA